MSRSDLFLTYEKKQEKKWWFKKKNALNIDSIADSGSTLLIACTRGRLWRHRMVKMIVLHISSYDEINISCLRHSLLVRQWTWSLGAIG